jgi:hypothetical protein
VGVGVALAVGLVLGFVLGDFEAVLRGFAFGEVDGFAVVEFAGALAAGWLTTPAAETELVVVGCTLARTLNPTTTRLAADIAAATRRLIGPLRGSKAWSAALRGTMA